MNDLQPSEARNLPDDPNLLDSGIRLNVEIKARSARHVQIKALLVQRNARRVGLDHQIDTYFRVQEGRLKLREGSIENSLIYYSRSNQAGPKRSDVLLYKLAPDPALKNVLTASNGVLVVVDKQREIWFDGNVKLHLDTVNGLGTFVEIEAIDADGSRSEESLRQQCDKWIQLLEIEKDDLVEVSYSDLLMAG